jgi:hypothetical protein
MNRKFVVSVLAAAAIYIAVVACFGAAIKLIAAQVPSGRMDSQFAPVACTLAVVCSYPETRQSEVSIDRISVRGDREGR